MSTVVIAPHCRSDQHNGELDGGSAETGALRARALGGRRCASGGHLPCLSELHQLSEALGLPYAELMRLSGYLLPGQPEQHDPARVSAALFADVSDEERDELTAYLAWYRSRRRS